MLRITLVAAAVLLLPACSSTPEAEGPEPTLRRAVIAVPHGGESTRVDRDVFSVEIPAAPLSFATCRVVEVDAGRRAIVVQGDASGPPRVASVLIATASGEVINYSDTRGAFQPTVVDGRMVRGSGRVSSISINIGEDLGVASNEGGDGPNERHVGTAADFLEDPGFDLPRVRITEIRERCGT